MISDVGRPRAASATEPHKAAAASGRKKAHRSHSVGAPSGGKFTETLLKDISDARRDHKATVKQLSNAIHDAAVTVKDRLEDSEDENKDNLAILRKLDDPITTLESNAIAAYEDAYSDRYDFEEATTADGEPLSKASDAEKRAWALAARKEMTETVDTLKSGFDAMKDPLTKLGIKIKKV